MKTRLHQSGRKDLRFGVARSVRLRPRQAYAGPPALRRTRIPRACASL
jgi:hypothetical protein